MTDDFRSALIGSARRLGVDPIDLATVISYETGGTFSPSIRGGAGNRHIGLIQFGIPEQKRYGASQDQSAVEQLPAVEAYLTDRGFRPGMGILDLYSTINAGRPGLYDRSDAGNGGAPGTVADKVRNQMSGHRAKAAAFLGGGEAAPVMTMPGETARSGRLGVAGVEPSTAPAPVMAVPEPEPATREADILALIAPLLQGAAGLAPSQVAAPAAARPGRLAPEAAPPVRFDAGRFYALLRR